MAPAETNWIRTAWHSGASPSETQEILYHLLLPVWFQWLVWSAWRRWQSPCGGDPGSHQAWCIFKCGIPVPDSRYHSSGLPVSVPPEQGYIFTVIYKISASDKSVIYIPLCFYFISWSFRLQRWERVAFTFHYASTLSEMRWPFSHPCYPFTFHYASTLSADGVKYYVSASKFTFHYASTLSWPRHFYPSQRWIYIPLCFYFIWFGGVSDVSRLYLHSIMLLLYLRLQDIDRIHLQHLHSIMLLLYRRIRNFNSIRI